MQKPTTVFCDLDGVVCKHNGSLTGQTGPMELLPGVVEAFNEWDRLGYNIILTTGRRESMRKHTEEELARHGLFYDQLIMGVGGGKRVLINDLKPDNTSPTAAAICVPRNQGLKGVTV